MPHYANAPIIEAVIDLKVQWPEGAPADAFDLLLKSLVDRFPGPAIPIRTVEMGYEIPADSSEEARFRSAQDVVGSRFQNDTRVLQVQRASFTYSHLPPYTEWAAFRPEAQELWAQFVNATGVQTVTRAAVRVINKLDLPGTPSEVAAFSNLYLQLPGGLAHSAETYFMQMQVPMGERIDGCRAIVSSAAGPAQKPGRFELVLDFDVFAEQRMDATSDDIWALLDCLSEIKNDLFEACITDETRGLIK